MRTAPAIDRLWAGHWPEPDTQRFPGAAARRNVFVIETCQRRLAIAAGPATALTSLHPPEQFHGIAAYQFLLEVAAGLRSAVPGETNVFGQVRRAWDDFRRTADRDVSGPLDASMACLIADTRAIRREHLQGIGGASYGALVRRLLRPADGQRVLFAGAGALARSMLAFFSTAQLGVWSRGPAGPAFGGVARSFAREHGGQAAEWADHVIITTPADPTNDQRWLAWLANSDAASAIHLGHRRVDGFGWPATLRGYDLDDVFDLQRRQDDLRSRQLQRALQACGERARRRAGEPAALAAGW